jgi:short subunit fatty acids transporter
MEDVNLLTQKKQEGKNNTLFTSTLLILLVVILVTVSMILYMLYLRTNISNISKEETRSVSEMQKYNDKRAKHLAIKDRLSTVGKILKQNGILQERINLLLQSFPSAVAVESINASGMVVGVKLYSQDLGVFDNLLDNDLKSIPGLENSHVKKIDVDKFGKTGSNSGYSVDIRFTFDSSIN